MRTTEDCTNQLELFFESHSGPNESEGSAVPERQHRVRPPHVLEAIMTGDKARLRQYSVKGNRSPIRNRKKAAVKAAACRKAKAEAQRLEEIAKEIRRAGEAIRQITFIDAVLEEYYAHLHYRYARAHARRNRHGSSHK